MVQPKKYNKNKKKKTGDKFYLNKIVKKKKLHMYRLSEEKQVIPRFK